MSQIFLPQYCWECFIFSVRLKMSPIKEEVKHPYDNCGSNLTIEAPISQLTSLMSSTWSDRNLIWNLRIGSQIFLPHVLGVPHFFRFSYKKGHQKIAMHRHHYWDTANPLSQLILVISIFINETRAIFDQCSLGITIHDTMYYRQNSFFCYKI